MDDYLDSFDNLDEVFTTVHELTPFLTFGCFNFATFILSNRYTKVYLEKLLTDRVLVLTWDAIMDMIKSKASKPSLAVQF